VMRLEAVCLLFTDLDPVELADWVAQGWVRAEPDGDALVFQAIDVARVRLVHDLRRAMAVDAETVGWCWRCWTRCMRCAGGWGRCPPRWLISRRWCARRCWMRWPGAAADRGFPAMRCRAIRGRLSA